MRIYTNLFNKLITPENLFFAWEEFRRDKKKKEDVLIFEKNLEREIFSLHRELKSHTYKHSGYTDFYISDPKRRHIHKARVRDRVLHHAIMGILYPLYEKTFIHNSFSCRIGKGTHKGVEALRSMLYKASKNNTRNVYILKCDIEKFFDSINHEILLSILSSRIKDQELMNLLTEVVESFTSNRSTLFDRCGVPIGNLTSQLFANVYMDIFDQFMKHELKVKYYARYTDDFVIVSESKEYLLQLLPQIQSFLKEKLVVQIHPKKVTITKFGRGIDYLGYVLFPHFTLVRKRTQKRALRKINEKILLYKKEEIYRRTHELIEKNYDALQAAKPRVSKNSAGYMLWNILNKEKGTFDLTRLFVGSQGTLGLHTSATFHLVKPKTHSRLLVLFLKKTDILPSLINHVLEFKPESFESYDDHTFKIALKMFPQIVKRLGGSMISLGFQFLPEFWAIVTGGIPKLVMLAEFTGDSDEEAYKKALEAQKSVLSFNIKTLITSTEAEAEKYWVVRRESFNLLRQRVKNMRTACFIDDLIVKPIDLPQFIPELYSLLDSYNLTYTIAGHMGDANFHIIPLMDLSKESARATIYEITEKVYHLVFKYKGSITAEHNDGLMRTPYLEEMFGPTIYKLFEEVKNIFDPLNIFNPGKKVFGSLAFAKEHVDIS